MSQRKSDARWREREGGRKACRGGAMNGEAEKKEEQLTVLLTGFSGWGLISTNPSQLIAERVGDLAPRLANGRVQLVTATLPVQWEAATEGLRALIAQLRPVAVLCLGLSQGISSLHVERVAVNLWCDSHEHFTTFIHHHNSCARVCMQKKQNKKTLNVGGAERAKEPTRSLSFSVCMCA